MPPNTGATLFRLVRPLSPYALLVEIADIGEVIYDFEPRLHTTRFADLRNKDLFNSVTTDGANLKFQIPGQMPVRITGGEFLIMAGLAQ